MILASVILSMTLWDFANNNPGTFLLAICALALALVAIASVWAASGTPRSRD